MGRTVLISALLIFLGTPSWAASGDGDGRPTCGQRLMRGTVNYLRDVVESKGVRFFLKPEPDIPRRGGIYNYLVTQPISHLSNAIGLGRREPAFPLVLVLAALTVYSVEAASDELYAYEIASQIETNRDRFDELVEFDFRFHAIKERRVRKEISLEDQRNLAYWLKFSLDKYYAYRASNPNDEVTVDNQMKYLPLFVHLQSVFKNGVEAAPGFIVPSAAQGQLDDRKKLLLFEINHSLFLDYQRIVEELEGRIPSNTADPFHTRILALLEQKKIQKLEAQRALQEDSYWRHRMMEWNTLGVKRLNVTNGRELSLQDLRAEILTELEGSRR